MSEPNFKTSFIDHDPRRDSVELIKDLDMLAPYVRAKVEAMISDGAKAGHKLVVLETYRSPARQIQMYHEGKSHLKTAGTHGFGLACDLGILGDNDQVNWQADYGAILVPLAKNHLMISGHDWGLPDKPHDFRDNDHVQFVSVRDQEKLFAGEWYPDGTYNPYLHL